MSMKFEKTENANELKLEFTIEAEKFEKAIKTVYTKSAKYFNIPGFRKGKAPFEMAEKMYGTEIFYEDAFNEVVPPIFEEELKTNNIEAVSKPEIDIKQMEKGKDLVFTAIIQTKPEVKLGKYKGIQLKKIEYTVSDEDIDKELNSMAERNSRLVAVEDRPVENKDIVVMDFEGFVDGKAFEGGKAERYELEIGSNTFIPGFEDQMVGIKINEEKDINVKFPDEYFSEELKGKDATFKVKVHEIKKKEMPEINDEFAKDTSEFDTLDELKSSIKEKLENENSNRAKYETEDEAIKTVCDEAEVDIPSGMIETEVDNIIKDVQTRLQYQGMNLDNYLKMIGKTMEEFRKENEEQAKVSVKNRLVLEAIVKAENIEADEDSINTKVTEMAGAYGKTPDELKKNEQFMNYVKSFIVNEKVVKFIVDNAKIK